MWKLIALGFVVQLVLLATILDVKVINEDDAIERTQVKERRPCSRNLMVVVIEGLQYEDILKAVDSTAVASLVPESVTVRVNVSSTANDTASSQGSIFDHNRVLYVGPPATPYHFNTTLWDFVLITDENGTSNGSSSPELDRGSDVVDDGRIIVDHMMRIIESERTDYYPLKFINIGRSSAEDQPLTQEERVWYFTKTFELMRNTSRSPSYIFMIASSMSMLVRNATEDHFEDYLLIHGHSECVTEIHRPFFNDTIDYDQAYYLIEGYVTLTSLKRDVAASLNSHRKIEGNLLELTIGQYNEINKIFMIEGLHLSCWETLNAIFHSLDFAETDTNSVVLAFSVFIFIMWISLLITKTAKMYIDSYNGMTEVNTFMLRYLDVLCLILLLAFSIATKLSGCPYRYLVYFSVGLLVFRMLCGELLSSEMLQTECSLLDKVKIGIQISILASIVECLFWSILYEKILIIVFAVVAFGRLVQSTVSVISFKIIIAFSVATFFVGWQYLWSFSAFGALINLNLSAALWIAASALVIKFVVTKSNHDRFMLFLCALEVLLATTFMNIFLAFRFDYHSIVPVICFFMLFSFLLPLFGGPDPKYRLLEVAVATSAVFMFSSCHGEAIFLLSSFTLSFCSYLEDRATQKQLIDGDTYYLNIFPATFQAVLLILACHVIIPSGGEALLHAFSVLHVLGANGVFLFFKLGALLNLLEASFLSSGPRLVTIPNLYIVVIILNLISARAFIQYSLFSSQIGKAKVYTSHVLLHVVAALTFYLYPFVQILCNTCLFTICRKPQSTYIPKEPVN